MGINSIIIVLNKYLNIWKARFLNKR